MPSPAPWENDTPLGPAPSLDYSMQQMGQSSLVPPELLPEDLMVPMEGDERGFWERLGDSAKSFGSGLVRGATDLALSPLTIPLGGVNALGRLFGSDDDLINDDWLFGSEDPEAAPGWMEVIHGGLGDMLYEPQNEGEEAIENVASFLPAGLAGPGGLASRVTRFGLIPGVVSEGAGQVFDDTQLEGHARLTGALVGGGLGMIGAGGASRAVQHILPPGVTQADIDAAGQLMTSAQAMGINLTWPEALHRTTNGRVNVTDVQRFIESSRGGAPVMSEVMSQRPGQVAGAVRAQTDTMGPQVDFATAGLRVQEASKGAIDSLNQRINAVTEPLLQQAGPQVVPPMVLAQLRRDPLFERALTSIRNDEVYSRSIAGYPDNSVLVLQQIKRWLEGRASTAGRDGDRYAASVYGDVAETARSAGQRVSPEYASWLARQTDLRRDTLEPAQSGPLGQMAGTSSLEQQVNAMFPRAPMPGSDQVVAQTVQRVAARDPAAAQALVRSYLEREFDDASRRIMGSANQWSGARFAQEVAGSSQQAFNLETAITNAFPDGAQRWAGFQELLRVLEATGTRQRPGSATQANMSFADEFSRGSRVGEAVTTATSLNRLTNAVSDAYRRIQLTGNTRRLAQIMTDPAAGPLLAQLAGARNVFEKTRLAGVLLYQAQAADDPSRVFGSDPWGGDTPVLLPIP